MTTFEEELAIAVSMTDEDWADRGVVLDRRSARERRAAGERVHIFNNRPATSEPDFEVITRFSPPRHCQLRTGSVQWDEQLLGRLKVEVAGERGLTQRSVLNVLLGHWISLRPEERRAVKDEALAWEEAQR